jgi:hypothetical protein
MKGKKIMFESKNATCEIEGIVEDVILENGNTKYLISYEDYTGEQEIEIILPSQVREIIED